MSSDDSKKRLERLQALRKKRLTTPQGPQPEGIPGLAIGGGEEDWTGSDSHGPGAGPLGQGSLGALLGRAGPGARLQRLREALGKGGPGAGPDANALIDATPPASAKEAAERRARLEERLFRLECAMSVIRAEIEHLKDHEARLK